MNRRLLVASAALVVLGAVLYIFVIRDDGDDAVASDPAAAAARPERDLPQPRVQRMPTRDTPTAPTDEPVTYEREDGTTVVDHRTNPTTQYTRPALPHPSRSPVSAQVTAVVMKQVRPVVLKCMQGVPETAFGARPVVMTRAQISIDDKGTMTVHELGPAATDIDATAAAAALDCIRKEGVGLTAHVDHPAVETATLAFPIRPLDYRSGK